MIPFPRTPCVPDTCSSLLRPPLPSPPRYETPGRGAGPAEVTFRCSCPGGSRSCHHFLLSFACAGGEYSATGTFAGNVRVKPRLFPSQFTCPCNNSRPPSAWVVLSSSSAKSMACWATALLKNYVKPSGQLQGQAVGSLFTPRCTYLFTIRMSHDRNRNDRSGLKGTPSTEYRAYLAPSLREVFIGGGRPFLWVIRQARSPRMSTPRMDCLASTTRRWTATRSRGCRRS